MNEAYHQLLPFKDELTDENFMSRLREVSTYNFNEKQIKLLKRDLLEDVEQD